MRFLCTVIAVLTLAACATAPPGTATSSPSAQATPDIFASGSGRAMAEGLVARGEVTATINSALSRACTAANPATATSPVLAVALSFGYGSDRWTVVFTVRDPVPGKAMTLPLSLSGRATAVLYAGGPDVVSPGASLSASPPAHARLIYYSVSGTLVVNADGRSGAVDAGLQTRRELAPGATPPPTDATERISGRWQCS